MSDKKQDEKKDLPLLQDQQNLLEGIRKILNPDNDNPQMDEYITSCFGYVMQALYKVSNAEDREKASEEIAEDLKERFERWKDDFEKRKSTIADEKDSNKLTD
ncbi:uncharacterized protein PRCAT00004610001 [Priceomyces carsonii]|uniref:uncharacterized protein n=1 Tax=Priceomyces carsonii TaxID=28549 RepID=UPI002EDA913A|nr:unnamed protein product [Priceomyces carsonii]